ncbi:MAG: hypothetical protein U0797_16195 [Gemmataceae bacterium]
MLGNHDLNALEGGGRRRRWGRNCRGCSTRPGRTASPAPRPAGARARAGGGDDILAFLATLPVALERDGELPVRVVHAAWEFVDGRAAAPCRDAVAVNRESGRRSTGRSATSAGWMTWPGSCTRTPAAPSSADVRRRGRHPEADLHPRRAAAGAALPWWRDYSKPVLCVIGHYWRVLAAARGEV